MPSARPVRRPLVLAAIMASMFMIAIEATIVSTAMPQIAAQLGDLHIYSWVFAAFLLAQTATTVIFGKLADLFGRKPVLLGGIAVFLFGSLLCGFAWSMFSLIIFRLVQGIGAGAIQPIALTVVGDLYPGQQRAKIQGWIASVWGISSVVGPLAGGLIVQHVSWGWVFWINLPIGLLAAAGFAAFLHETVTQRTRSLDVLGAGLFATAIAALMVGLTSLGTAGGGLIAMAGGIFIVSALAFVWQERRARDPMVVFGLWARPLIATANLVTLFSGMALIGLTTFLPIYVQGVLGRSPLVAGFALTVMVLGWPIGATLASRNMARFGLRRILIFGSILLPLGAIIFVTLGPDGSPVVAGLGSMLMGLGMGFSSTSAIMIIQNSVNWDERGSATASNIFSRNLGSTLGASALGAVLNLSLTSGGGGNVPVDPEQLRHLLDHAGGPVGDAALRMALAHGLHLIFCGVLVIAVCALLTATRMPPVAGEMAARKAPAG